MASREAPSLTKFTTLTFDCYGTLIDWEKVRTHLRRGQPDVPPRKVLNLSIGVQGILAAFEEAGIIDTDTERLLSRFADSEHLVQAGTLDPKPQV